MHPTHPTHPLAYRLTQTVRPIGYAVDISTSPNRTDFEGFVEIALELQAHTRTIEMHARDLQVQNARISVGTHTFHTPVALDKERELAIISLEHPLAPGRVQLTLHFRGAPNASMHGLYLAQDGPERAICTQCEATDARAIFPCFDEPEFKATISWRIRTDGSMQALCNSPLIGVEEDGPHKIWRFETSAPIPSYLFALVVGDFEATAPEISGASSTPCRVWTHRGKVSQAKFAHNFTLRLVPWYERYFAQNYPFKKYDQVAVPGFDAGAMENVGLVLFRQNLLLMSPESASWNQEKTIAKVIAHEMAHMWFGNLVTMKWWDDLWLNEAFAEWMAHKAVSAIEPSYLVWNDFQMDKNRALIDDALPTTHPIWNTVNTPSEAIEMFDVITYQKGCAVMRMLENFLGEAPFGAGLQSYMRAFAFANAAGSDLWQHLEQASQLPVATLMRSWIEQPGFPVVEVQDKPSTSTLRICQQRFFSSPRAVENATEQLWSVPMVVRFEDDVGVHEHRFILNRREHNENLPAQGPVKWCYANAHEIGFYRVHARGKIREGILQHALTHLTPVEQMGFLEDQWALVRNASTDAQPFLGALKVLFSATDHNVLRTVIDRLGSLDLLLKDARNREARTRFRTWIGQALQKHLDQLGYVPRPQEPQNDMQRRSLLIGALGGLARVPEVIETCVQWAAQEQNNPRAVDANLAGTFVGIAAKFGDLARYDSWITTYHARKAAGAPPQDCLRYLYTLSAFRLESTTRRTLSSLLDGTIPQEAIGSILGQLLAGRHGQMQAWEYLKQHWDTFKVRVGDMGLSRLVESVGALPANQREQIASFFQDHTPKGAERALARALEGLDQREELRQRITPGLLQRFLAEV